MSRNQLSRETVTFIDNGHFYEFKALFGTVMEDGNGITKIVKQYRVRHQFYSVEGTCEAKVEHVVQLIVHDLVTRAEERDIVMLYFYDDEYRLKLFKVFKKLRFDLNVDIWKIISNPIVREITSGDSFIVELRISKTPDAA